MKEGWSIIALEKPQHAAEAEIERLASELDAATLSRGQRALEDAYKRVEAMPEWMGDGSAAVVAGVDVLQLGGVLPRTRREIAAALDQASGRWLTALVRRKKADLG